METGRSTDQVLLYYPVLYSGPTKSWGPLQLRGLVHRTVFHTAEGSGFVCPVLHECVSSKHSGSWYTTAGLHVEAALGYAYKLGYSTNMEKVIDLEE